MENKLKDNEIIKALECCITNDCAKCKAYDETNGEIVDCLHAICRNALDLINRQKAEIERLNVELAGMRGAAESYKIHYDKAQTKIKALKEALDGETVQNMRLGHEVERLNADLEKALKDEADIHISI